MPTTSCRAARGTPRTGFARRIRCGDGQFADEARERLRKPGAGFALHRRAVGPVEPVDDAPRPGEGLGGHPDADRDGHRNADALCDPGQQPLLVLDEVGGDLPARHAHGKPFAQPVELVVPAVGDEAELCSEVGMLLGDETIDERGVGPDVGGGCVAHRSNVPGEAEARSRSNPLREAAKRTIRAYRAKRDARSV